MNDHSMTIEQIEQRLREQFNPTQIAVIDESAKHRGHQSAPKGQGHFAVKIQSDMFKNMSLLQRHRAIYAALDDLMNKKVHALRINAKALDEQ